MPRQVKVPRYDASGRRARAQARREQILDVALELFLRDGFVATTVAAVATAAEVSVETVYKAFGGKPGLVEALRVRALRGSGGEPAEERSDRLHESTDARAVVRGWARLATEVAPRVVPILLLVRDAAVIDPSLRSTLADMETDRARRMRDNAAALARSGHLRPGVSSRAAADVLFAVSSPEMYELLVLRQRWSLRRYARYVEDVVTSSLLAD